MSELPGLSEREPQPTVGKIFYVEDNAILRKTVQLTLSANADKYQIALTATSVPEALAYIPDRIVAEKIDVAVIDNSLGDRSGSEIAQAIRDYESSIKDDELVKRIKVISYSFEQVTWGDINLLKGPDDLSAFLNEYFESKQKSEAASST